MICAWLLGALSAAHAGVPVALPPTESPARWSEAFEVAGLEAASTPARAQVRIEAGESHWRLVALQDGTPARTVTVAAPIHEAQRLEVAFLARALARSMEPLDAPARGLELPAPPAPEWFAAVPAPAQPAPNDPPAAPVASPEPEPEEVAPEPPPVEPEPPEEPEQPESVPEAPPVEPNPFPIPPDRPVAVPDPPPKFDVRYPPVALSTGASWRGPQTGLAASFGLQVAAARTGPFELAFHGDATTRRRLYALPGPDLFQSFTDLRVAAVLRWDPGWVQPELLGGVGRRAFSQQGRLVTEMTAPFVGVGLEAGLRGTFAPGLRARALVDLRGMQLVSDAGRRATLLPVDLGLDFLLRIRPPRDPFSALPTLPEQ